MCSQHTLSVCVVKDDSHHDRFVHAVTSIATTVSCLLLVLSALSDMLNSRPVAQHYNFAASVVARDNLAMKTKLLAQGDRFHHFAVVALATGLEAGGLHLQFFLHC